MNHAEHTRWQEAVHHLLDVQRPEQAEQLVRRRLATNPKEAAAHQLLALTLLNQSGRTAEGLSAIREALVLDPQQARAHYFHSVALLRDSQLFAAMQAIEEALRLDPRNATFFGYQAVIHNARRHSQEALQATAAGLAINPGHLECQFQRVTALRQLGRPREAANTIRLLAYWHPNHPVAHQLQGEEALRNHQLSAAEVHFREALRLRPGAEQSRKSLQEVLEWQAESAFNRQDLPRAVALYQDILLLEPNQPEATRRLWEAGLFQHWSQRPFAWQRCWRATSSADTNVPLLKRLAWPLLLALPLLVALAARTAFQVRYAVVGPVPLLEDGWFYAGLLWAAATLGLAQFPPIPLPALWVAVAGGLGFALRNSYRKWRQGTRKWPLGPTLLLSPGSMALVNGHGNWLNPDGANEAAGFLMIFAGLLLVYHVFRPVHQPAPASPS
ncbi:tetratricopeptide repeat protein [Hymenobacter glacieicola]|uniref:Tetratricopeptide repeat protein n=1 Tax=Hymenobacter glacieicola TaxID=1562124 RepID=A0ABQ1WZM5_9BACT|nr:tetratricopeptide repeat protein [Hymenobacter glacieicola]GGG52685.1 hypothetical protein GCM10011378_31170 [Hymenobacter glacieicola]